MTRNFALAVGILLSSVSAGSLLAQTSSAPKHATDSSMQHSQAAPAARPMQHVSGNTSTAAPGTVAHSTWTKAQIEAAQEGLAKAGFYQGKPTGVLDRQTRRAVKAYQKANKLPVTGRLNNELLTRLHPA